MKNIRWRVIVVLIVLVIALFKIYPTIKWASLSDERKQELNKKWEELAQKKKESIDRRLLKPSIREESDKELIEQGKEIPPNPSMFRDIRDGLKKWWLGDQEQVLKLGLDLKGGIRVELDMDPDYTDQVLNKLMDRIDQFGVAEPDIRKLGDRRISIELPGATNIERVRKIIEQQAFMQWILVNEDLMKLPEYSSKDLLDTYKGVISELKAEHSGEDLDMPYQPSLEEIDERMHANNQIPEDVILRVWDRKDASTGTTEQIPLLLMSTPEDPEIITGDEIEGKSLSRDLDQRGLPEIRFTLKREATKKFAEVTRKYNAKTNPISYSLDEPKGWRLAILVDGKIISAPHIATEIVTGSGVITGQESTASADDLVVRLKSGSLAVKPEITNIVQVGPRLGADSIRMGIRAALLGVAFVVVFMVVYYLKSGIIAIFALCLNILIVLAALSTLGATLTLPGIAGIILTIGMAVDANVLIFERIREEFAAAKKIRAAISSGYDKAFRTILDANLTTLITALILYKFGTGPIKGFAVTLSLGIIASMFTALFVTRLVYEILLRAKSFESLKMFQFFSQPNIDFTAFAKRALVISGIVIAIGITSVVVRSSDILGIDFSGGSELLLEFKEDVDVSAIRSFVQNDLGYEDAQVRLTDNEGGKSSKVSIQSKTQFEDNVDERIQEGIGVSLESVNYTTVGPAYAATLWQKAIIAMVLSLAGIIAYVWFRFEFLFGIAAVVALIHDVLITLGIFSGMLLFPSRQLNLPIIAAILTIIGYSLNDTIVVFDRIREDLKIMKRLTFRQIINTSINQTLGRTVLTSVTTLLVLISLLLLGGQAVSDFAFAMMIGVIVGTYSSIFIASPILLFFHKKRA